MQIYCVACKKEVAARLTDGVEIYPHRPDLAALPFWRCNRCRNYVGCHHKTKNRTAPLGNIPTSELRRARGHIHKILDPIWKSKKRDRNQIYTDISKALGFEYHTATIASIEQAREVYRFLIKYRKTI